MINKKAKNDDQLPPIIPIEIEQKLYENMKNTFGFDTGGEYTVSLEIGIEDSDHFNKVMDMIRDHDRKQVINRHGKECYYVTYNLKQLQEMLNLYYAMQTLEYKEMYINHLKLPYAHSLWIQLFQLMA
jgi:hypothetical protein